MFRHSGLTSRGNERVIELSSAKVRTCAVHIEAFGGKGRLFSPADGQYCPPLSLGVEMINYIKRDLFPKSKLLLQGIHPAL